MGTIKSFWPLPGGIKNYFNTLINILEFIREKAPDFITLKKWIINTYSLTSEEKTTRGYLNVIRNLEMINYENGKYMLTSLGLKILDTRNHELVFKILCNKIFGIKEIVDVISSNQPIDKKSVNTELNRILTTGWKTDAQVGWRLNWLLSLGIIESTSNKYYLTEFGIQKKSELEEIELTKNEKSPTVKEEKLEELSHNDLEDKLKYIGEFFEFISIKRPKINEMLPDNRKLKISNKALDGLWVKKIPMGGKIYYPIEIQIGGNLSDTIDRLETVSEFAQKTIIVIDFDQENILRERLKSKVSKLSDKLVCIRPDDVNKIMSATNALKSFFIDLFK